MHNLTMLDVATRHFAMSREMNANEFAETRRVVVAHGFRITCKLVENNNI
jgi:hypothetical protein